MIHLRFKKIAKVTSFFLILAVVFLIPVFFSYFFPTGNTFELPKNTIFKILVLLLSATTILERALTVNGSLNLVKLFSKYRNYLLVIVLFILSLVISTFLSLDHTKSLYGIYERQQGFFAYAYYLLFFILILINIRSLSKFKIILLTTSMSSFFVCFYGVLQRFGFDFVKWSESFAEIGRVTSTFGQPNFLASYLLLVIPITTFLLFDYKQRIAKIFLSIILLLQLACLFFTYSMGGWIGLIGGFLIAAVIYLIKNKNIVDKNKIKVWKNPRNVIPLFLVISFLLLFFFIFANSTIVKYKVASLVDWKNSSTASRINFWQASTKAIADKPIFGYGLEMQGEVLVKYYQKNWGVLGDVNTYPDRAHNFLLDSLLTGGLANFVALLLMLFIFIKSAIKNIRNNNNAFLMLAFLWSIIAYLISLMFSFSVVATNVYLWLFLALIAVASAELSKNKDENNNETESMPKSKKALITQIFLAAVILSIVFCQINKNLNLLIADYYAGKMQVALQENDIYTFLELSSYLDKDTMKSGYYNNQIISALTNFSTNRNFSSYQASIAEIAEKILANIKSGDYSSNLNKARIYTILAEKNNSDEFTKAEYFYTQVRNYSPEMPKTYYEIGNMYAKKKDYVQATNNYEIALSKLPDLSDPYLNEKHANAIKNEKRFYYLALGNVFLEKGETNNAEYYYDLAIKNNVVNNYNVYFEIAKAYYLHSNFDKALHYTNQAYSLDTSNYYWPLSISQIYQDKGDKKTALKYAQEALKLNPSSGIVNKLVTKLQKEVEIKK